MATNKINIKNKKAYFDFEIQDKYVAGIKLAGTEIKSIRAGKVSLVDSYCYVKDREVWVKGIRIAEYENANHYNHEPYRDRKLLLNKQEIKKIERKTRESGFTLVALRLFLTERGLAKIEIALARGKKEFDKRETIKKKDVQIEMDRMRKSRY